MTELEKLEKELLEEIQEEPEIYADTEEFCTINPETRIITVPTSKRILGTESDQETNRLYFKCPKIVGDNVDLSLFSLRINYQNAGNKKDQYLVEDVKEEGDNITFSWLLKRNVTAYKGNVKFILCAVKTTEDGIIKNEWNTTLNTECESLEGMEVDKVAVEEETKDIVEQLIAMMNHSAENAVRAVEEAKAEVDKEVGDFALKAQQALADVNNAGQAQTERVQTAGDTAVESVKTEQGAATHAVQTEGTTQAEKVSAEGTRQTKQIENKGQEVLQSIPKDFPAQMATKLDKQQGVENAGKVLVVGEDGNVVPQEETTKVEVDSTLTKSGKAADAKATGDKILQFAIKNTVTGESPLVVPDSAEEPVLGFGLTGKTEQVSTTGAQLWDKSIAMNPDSWNAVEGRALKHMALPLEPNTTYTMSLDKNNMHKDYKQEYIGKYAFYLGENPSETGGNFLFGSSGTAVSVVATKHTFTTSNKPYYANLIYDLNNPDGLKIAFEELLPNLMLAKSSTTTPYEPYTGGKPSPSPDYPQEIVNAGKRNEDTQKYEVRVKVTCKNFLTDNYEQYTDGKYKQKVALPAGNYIYTCEKNNNIWLLHEDGSNITNGWMATNKFNFSLAKKETIELRIETKNLAGNNHMIRLQGSDDVYVPYREPQSLTLTSDRPITKWDKLVEQDGRIGWLYKMNTVTLDGNPKENWKMHTNNQSFFIEIENAKFQNSFCNKYRQKLSAWAIQDYAVYSDNNNAQKYFRPPHEGFEMNIDAWKTFLNTNPLTVVYETETTEFVPLPQSEQNAIRALETYYPTTVITTDGGELNPDVELDYVADTRNFVLVQIKEIAQKQLATDALLLERTV